MCPDLSHTTIIMKRGFPLLALFLAGCITPQEPGYRALIAQYPRDKDTEEHCPDLYMNGKLMTEQDKLPASYLELIDVVEKFAGPPAP